MQAGVHVTMPIYHALELVDKYLSSKAQTNAHENSAGSFQSNVGLYPKV